MLHLERISVAPPRGKANDASNVFGKFTRRERDVVRLVLKGMKNDDISAELGIGIGSIRNIKLRLYRKTGVSSEGELVPKLIAFKDCL